MNYVGFINSLIRAKTATSGHLVMYGQNIAAGSCLSGLTGGLESKGGRLVLNTPNSENTLLGTGFGLMMADVNAIYFMKQQDFLLLGVDQLVNTYNLIRQRSNLASFTIVQIVVDSGFEGPQSAFNNLPDFCSIARVPGYTISNAHDAAKVIDRHLVSPGFRIIGVSQRLFRTEPIESADHVSWNDDGDVLRYSDGTDVTIAAFNFAFPQALELWRGFKERNIDVIPGDGFLPAVVPSVVDSLILTLDRYGTLSLADVVAPAIELAEKGFPMYGEFKGHIDLGNALGLFDIERGVKLAGSRNYVLTGPGAMLHEAVLRLAWDIMIRHGYTPLTVPVLVNERLMYGTGFFPMHRDEVYLAERDNQCLVGTSEVPVTGLHCDEILDLADLPKKYFARSTCFRRESGAAGKDTR
ncbi:MAG: gamma-glutamyltransferase, partial [Proteobacteria bacterium]|nr:gamma-glutamyltransferase [Pseudomonadota bacterium]